MANNLICLCSIALMLSACATEAGAGKGDGGGGGGKEDRWNWRNAPERFDGEFNYHLADLPMNGTAERESWPSSYWPTYENSIVARWQHTGNPRNDLSPAEKYDLAFNGWEPDESFYELRPFDRDTPVPNDDWDPAYYDHLGPLASLVSQRMGNRPDREQALEHGGRPPEGTEWETETWFGLCHAWVPAAMLEDRPLRTVVYNDVVFHVGDMEALLIAAYNRSAADMIGGRCNTGSGDETVERDEQGRAIDVECRDTNPGSLHVILTNYLGMLNRAFAFDRTFDYEVWNQPVTGYDVTRQEEITVAEANELLGLTGDTYTLNPDAVKLYRVHTTVDWLTESHASVVPNETSRYTRSDRYTYILEVDAEGKVIGGEWFGGSRHRHPDFLWNPRRITRSSVPNLSISDIRMLVQMSRAEPNEGELLMATGDVAEGGLAIPDNDAEGISSTASLSGEGVVTGVRVGLDVTHPFVGDLLITLEHGGVTRTVHNREGGSKDNLTDTVTVVGFEGAEAAGEWTLTVSDNANSDVGTLNGWTLNVIAANGTPEPPPVDTARRFQGEGGLAIPDNDPTGVTSTANVSGVTDGDVSIDVNIAHTYIGDLTILVTHNGRTWTLHNREGGNDEDIRESYPLDAIGNAFEGDPTGTWTLQVIDNAHIDVGTLTSWAVVVR